MSQSKPFWETKSLGEMSKDEWESLCDGCAKCCLRKLEDADTGEVHFTDVACYMLDTASCRCIRYPRRLELVSDCVEISVGDAGTFAWMPSTCAYRLLAEGQPLPPWHPLLSGDPESVHRAGMSVRGRTTSEQHVHDSELEERIVEWPK